MQFGQGSRSQFVRIAVALLLIGGIQATAAADDLKEAVDRLGGKDCTDSTLTCVDIAVPVDHAKPGSNQRIKVRFAVSFASEEAKGILFYAVGGPGGSGLAVADSYLASFDTRLTKEMDVVFFDQRGIGPLTGINCPKAGLVLDQTSFSLDQPESAIEAAKTFAAACAGEMAHVDLLPHLSTADAVQDLEDFRQAIGAPKVWLYGESYGTQLAQTYAARYPQALKGLILDGVVDLTRDAEHFYGEDVRTAETLLAKTLDACDADAQCRADMSASAGKVYDDLAAKLKTAPIAVDFPLAEGGFAQREMTTALLETDAFYALYGPDSRASFLRALAAGANGNFMPLLRLGYQSIEADPETLEPNEDPSWYGGAYYGITCPDYDDAGQETASHAQEILKQARALAPTAPRLIRDFYVERLVCSFWPVKGARQRPAPFPGGDFPTLVLNSDSDPATPVVEGYSVFDHAKNASMVTMQGGPHVIWGRGLGCPDKIVYGLMLDGRKPEKPEQICRQDFMERYVPLTGAKTGDAFGLGRSVEIELAQAPELVSWDGTEPITFGCDFGGSLTATAAEAGTDYTFEDCAFWPGLKVSGDGVSIDAGDGTKPDGLTLHLQLAGAHRGRITYRHDTSTEARSVAGDFDGQPALNPRPLP
jgi:pimeloyl-ACP methyl ester carboxylesterase